MALLPLRIAGGDFALERATDLAETVLRSTAVVDYLAEASDASLTSGGRL
jgi:hypothetical protein